MILGFAAMTWRTCSAISRTFSGSGPIDAELDREADRRTEHEAVDPRPRRRHGAVGEGLFEPRLDPLARLEVLGDDDDLGEVRVGQDRVEPEPEARRALADIGGVGDDVGIAGKQALGLLRGRVGDADRRAFGQPHLEEQLGPGRGREELLLDQAESRRATATNMRTVAAMTVLRQRKAQAIKRRRAR